jgi:hypothetical protein
LLDERPTGRRLAVIFVPDTFRLFSGTTAHSLGVRD